MGLYTALVPLLVYAVMGTSRPVSVTTTSTIAILTAAALHLVAPNGTLEEMRAVAATLAFLVGAILLIASVLRMGIVANLISEPILIGFKGGFGRWPDAADIPAGWKPAPEMGNAFCVALLSLEACDDTERALMAHAVSLTVEPGQLQSLMQAESTATISKPMLVVVGLWLVMIFLSFSLIAPPNATANFALIASALCPTGAILLILGLNRPFGGLMRKLLAIGS